MAKGWLYRFAPLLVVIAGIALLLYPTVSNLLIEQNASHVVQRYGEAVEVMSDEERREILDAARAYNAALAQREGVTSGEADGAQTASPEEREQVLAGYDEVLNLDGNGLMGYISIPRIDVTLPIYHGVEERVLQQAVGHVEGTSLPVGGSSAHAVLSGHRGLPSAKLFTDLDEMQVGDVFYIRVLEEVHAYQVDGIETVLPDETESLAIVPGEDRVTLVTCTPYGINSHRLLVHAHAIPYTPDMEDEVGKPGSFINIPLPYLMLIIGLVAIAVALVALRVWAGRRGASEGGAATDDGAAAAGLSGDGPLGVAKRGRFQGKDGSRVG